ncbi:PTS sugar transporter subunit IIA [Thermoactinomyces intermedius]|jgi:galactitol PTS system EIIA component|uniref:PTS sugar transporter subunit IIA n=1 Tax=Thermoactinomyces intermedius TaxID=2024 RepID=A0A8I1AFJ8_THEIN|nr:PTS sugar transporter subunit IIA [Thermoactinomyces intermedius]MBA4547402.1 PTS sugar transporter subunit IIA [Thermoactinomyces intermedius]MBA4835918.1 PTS sugar transporter subunit IIA [Thermoactinomyces intermedius]MBH8596394.1 PTS sugar transporter subunit IIA [Thermoactinomyces intermedius]
MCELFLDESIILLDIEGETKEEVLKIMADQLVRKGLVKKSFVHAVIQRENQFATGLPTAGASVAIPHTDKEHVKGKAMSIAVLKKPVDFGVMGEDHHTVPVKIVFMLVMDEADSQLILLQKLTKIFGKKEILEEIVRAEDKNTIKKVMKKELDLQ